MSGVNKESTRLGNNIRGLRKMWGETQLDLAIAIGLDNGTTISNYEVGRNDPDRDILIKIAKHYRVTEDELLYGDFENMKFVRSMPSHESIDLLKKHIPFFTSEQAEENVSFKNALARQNRMWNLFKNNGADYENLEDLIEDYHQCIAEYKLASDQKVIEATANYTGLIALGGAFFHLFNQELIDNIILASESKNPPSAIELMRTGGFLPTFLENAIENADDEWKQKAEDFLKKYEVDYFIGILLLKHSKKFWDLGDYYFALRYVCNIISDPSLTPEMKTTMGFELLSAYGLMRNKYIQIFNTETDKEK